ncbi:MAG TPA: cytochrome c biogenesis protein CcdA [Alphaproteobacteria bacterium]|nr:cytochrome c biogenesis protein CcdA [Alphaproteobacteria bacterium]
MTATMAFAFLVGTVATVNPCGFVLLPAYFTRRLDADATAAAGKITTIANALKIGALTTTGVLVVFGLVGGAVSLGLLWLTRVMPWAGFAIGIVLTIAGLAVLAGKHIGVSLPSPRWSGIGGGGGDFVYGLGYGIVSLSCTLPIFLSVTGMALAGSPVAAALNFIAYALGMGTVLTTLSVAAALAGNGFSNIVRKFLPYVNRAGGALLFLAGLYVSYFWGSALFAVDLPGGSMLAAGESLSGDLRGWLGGEAGQFVVAAVMALLIAASVWVFLVRRKKIDQ